MIINGKEIAQDLRAQIKTKIETLSFQPCLAVILVGEDPASQVYVRNKIKACEGAGIKSLEHILPPDSTVQQIESLIDTLNANKAVNGILLQLPLPAHLSEHQEDLVQRIAPEKDVDGLSTTNAGKLFLGIKGGHIPCTPQGSLALIKSITQSLSGLHAVIIGRSNLFGKPMAQLLLQENCTVTTAHSRTKDLPALCRSADILIAAVGQPRMVKADWVKDGAIVIDVGINRVDEKLCGDVDFDDVESKAAAITPVPGGVGPMTIAYLLHNTLNAALDQNN